MHGMIKCTTVFTVRIAERIISRNPVPRMHAALYVLLLRPRITAVSSVLCRAVWSLSRIHVRKLRRSSWTISEIIPQSAVHWQRMRTRNSFTRYMCRSGCLPMRSLPMQKWLQWSEIRQTRQRRSSVSTVPRVSPRGSPNHCLRSVPLSPVSRRIRRMWLRNRQENSRLSMLPAVFFPGRVSRLMHPACCRPMWSTTCSHMTRARWSFWTIRSWWIHRSLWWRRIRSPACRILWTGSRSGPARWSWMPTPILTISPISRIRPTILWVSVNWCFSRSGTWRANTWAEISTMPWTARTARSRRMFRWARAHQRTPASPISSTGISPAAPRWRIHTSSLISTIRASRSSTTPSSRNRRSRELRRRDVWIWIPRRPEHHWIPSSRHLRTSRSRKAREQRKNSPSWRWNTDSARERIRTRSWRRKKNFSVSARWSRDSR